MNKRNIRLTGGAQNAVATVTWGPRDGLCHITLECCGRLLEADAHDYFEAFCKIRLQLELEGLMPFCYGASLNVYPSGMCRDMGGGSIAYRLTKGQRVSETDLVGIFDDGPDIVPTSVSAQRKFYEDWLKKWA